MKQNLFQRLSAGCVRSVALTVLLSGGLLAACDNEMIDNGQDKALSAGKRPLLLTASVETATRATADNTWDGGEKIGVAAWQYLGGELQNDLPEVTTYVAEQGGRMNADNPLWWTADGETKDLVAWHCGDGTVPVNRENFSPLPDTWSVQADQSDVKNYHKSDLLFASATNVGYNGGQSLALKFYHQTARIVVNIKKAEYADDAEKIKSVSIGDNNLKLTGAISTEDWWDYSLSLKENNTVGKWDIREMGDATIQAHRLDAPTQEEYLVSYEALVIPQKRAGLRLLAIETKDGMMYYTAPDDDEPFKAGQVYTYNITVKSGTPLQLEVKELVSGDWNCHATVPHTSFWKKTYGPDDLKIGDYFYSDGTYSDGGLRELSSNGTLKMVADLEEDGVNPGPIEEKKDMVVGIVFQTDQSRIGQAEKDALEGADALVLALKNAPFGDSGKFDGQWGAKWSSADSEDMMDCKNVASSYNDINGYANFLAIRKLDEDFSDYPAFQAAAAYSIGITGTNTTGWYLPSAGQWWDILQFLAGVEKLTEIATQESTETGTSIKLQAQHDILVSINRYMENIPVEYCDNFVGGKCYYTSSRRDKDRAIAWHLNKGDVWYRGYQRNQNYQVRPILAFKKLPSSTVTE